MDHQATLEEICAIIFIGFMFAYYSMGLVLMLLYKPGDWHYFAKEEAVLDAKRGNFLNRLCPGIALSCFVLSASLVLRWELPAYVALANIALYSAYIWWMRKTVLQN